MPRRFESLLNGPSGSPRRTPVTLTRSRVCAKTAEGSRTAKARGTSSIPRRMSVTGLGLLRRAAGAGDLVTLGAAGTVLRLDRLFQVHAVDVRKGRQPGEDVGELSGSDVPGLVTAKGRGKFTNFFHEPHERPGRSPAAVLRPKRVADQLLQIGQGHVPSAGRRFMRF